MLTKITPDFLSDPATLKLFQVIPDSKYTLRFVGGCVRDALLGHPVKDLDLATSLVPQKLMKILDQAKIKYVPTGINHGTITVIIDHTVFQITTLRCDVIADGRHAIVAFTDDWQLDALRRDFTINALSLDIAGKIYDYTNGLKDLTNNHLKFIGNPQQRIQEDYLRILRYFRFYARFGKDSADSETLYTIHLNAHCLERLSGERITTELIEILNYSDPEEILQMMIKTSVLKSIMNVTTLSPLWFNAYDNEKQFKNAGSPAWFRRFVALVEGNSDYILRMSKKLKFSKKTTVYLVQLANMLAENKILPFAGIYNFGLFAYQDYLLLTNFSDKKLLWQQAIDFNQQKIIFPLKGDDLIKEGLLPGPRFKQLLEKVKQWWMQNNGQASRAACLDYIKKNNLND